MINNSKDKADKNNCNCLR